MVDDPRYSALDPWTALHSHLMRVGLAARRSRDTSRRCQACLKHFSGRGSSAYCEACAGSRGIEKLRRGFGRDNLCPQGHALSGDNLYCRPDGRSQCRRCGREHKRRVALQRSQVAA